MITIQNIKEHYGLVDISKNLACNKGIVLDPWLFQVLESDGFRYRNHMLDFNVFLQDYGFDLQRPYVWETFQKRNFIENILCEKPISEFIFIQHIRNEGDTVFQVIDGKQRLITISDFIKNKFSIDIGRRTVHFDDFDKELKSAFMRCVNFFCGTVYYSDNEHPISDKDKIRLFNYYNFSGTPQTEEHKARLMSLVAEQ